MVTFWGKIIFDILVYQNYYYQGFEKNPIKFIFVTENKNGNFLGQKGQIKNFSCKYIRLKIKN